MTFQKRLPSLGEGHEGGRGPLALGILNDLNAIILALHGHHGEARFNFAQLRPTSLVTRSY